MYKVLFTAKAERTIESVNATIFHETGDPNWTYETMEDIEEAEKAGFLEFKDGNMTVYADAN